MQIMWIRPLGIQNDVIESDVLLMAAIHKQFGLIWQQFVILKATSFGAVMQSATARSCVARKIVQVISHIYAEMTTSLSTAMNITDISERATEAGQFIYRTRVCSQRKVQMVPGGFALEQGSTCMAKDVRRHRIRT